MRASGSAFVNVNASSFTLGTVTGSNAGTGFSPGPFTHVSGNEDGFGSFNLAINSFDGLGHSSDKISFTITNTSGGTWASAANVLVSNTKGFLAGIHVFVTNFPANASNGAIATGYAGNSPVIPEPSSLVLFGSGLIGLGVLVRRKLSL
jgi:hypothetical protein